MNKIRVEEEKFVANNTVAILNIKANYLKIDCYGHNKIFIIDKETLNLDITLEDNSSLDILIYEKWKKADNKIDISQNNNTRLTYREAFRSAIDTNITITNELKGRHNESNIELRCLSVKDNIMIDILAKALKNTKDNVITEDVKGLNDGGKITVRPNLEVNTEDISANHLVTISSIPRDYLFYFATHGIDEKVSKNIILKGFLTSIFKENKEILLGGKKDE